MTVSEIIALCSVAIALLSLLAGRARGAKTDATEQIKVSAAAAASQAALETKLDAINAGMLDIRAELRSNGNKLDEYAQKLAAVDTGEVKVNYFDELEKRFLAAHPPK